MSENTKLFLACDDYRWYFDKEQAEQQAKEVRSRGKRAEIANDGQFWMVYEFNN